MEKDREETARYVADELNKRLKDLGITRYRLVADANLHTKTANIQKLLAGKTPGNFSKVASLADLLGLEIVFRPKLSKEETLKKIKEYGKRKDRQ